MKTMYAIGLVLILSLSITLAHEEDNDHHMGDHMTDFGPVSIFMWTMMTLWIVLILVGIYYLVTSSKRKSDYKSPLKILKKRYAKGKITKDEFEMMKRDLET